MRRGSAWMLAIAAWLVLTRAAGAVENTVENDAYLAAVQLFNQHDWDGARKAFTAFQRSYPRSRWLPGVQLRLADLETDPVLAEKAYTAVLESSPDTEWAADARWALANTLFSLGRYADAAGHFQLLVQAGDPRRGRALYLTARCQHALGRTASARTLYTQVRDDFPQSPEAELALAALGDLEASAHHTDSALALYDQYLKTYPDGQMVEAVRTQRASLAPAEPAPLPTAASAMAAGPGEPSTTAPTAGGDAFTVQVGAFTKPEYASQLLKRLRRKGYNAYLLSARSGSGVFHQVRVGNYSRRSLAELIAGKLAKLEGLPTLVLPYTGETKDLPSAEKRP